MGSRDPRFVSVVVVAVSIVVAEVSKVELPAVSRIRPERIQPRNLRMDALLSAGYGGSVASIIWSDAMVSYGAMVMREPDRDLAVMRDLDLLVEQDTLWSRPFEFGGLALDDGDSVHARFARELLDRGVRRHPGSWRIRLYLGMMLDRDSAVSRDSVEKVLLPISSIQGAPDFARTIAFTVIQRTGNARAAMDLLLHTYELESDPVAKYHFRLKIGDLLRRGRVDMGDDAQEFLDGIGALLDSSAPTEKKTARDLLLGLMDSTSRPAALETARQLARQYAAYSTKK